MAAMEISLGGAKTRDDPNASLLGDQGMTRAKCASPKVWIPILILFFVGSIIATVFITKSVVENNIEEAAELSNSTTLSPTTSPTIPSMNATNSPSMSPTASSSPKNLIVIISDGMGPTYNAAYRRYKNLTKTTIDKHYKGKYSTDPTNTNGIPDSASGATVFACGVKTHNSFLCLDGYGNPKGSILAAAKRQGKGTGMVVTKSVTGRQLLCIFF